MFPVSVLETEKSLVLAEKGSGDTDDVELIQAAAAFRLVATMNPGGDFGKKEVDEKPNCVVRGSQDEVLLDDLLKRQCCIFL